MGQVLHEDNRFIQKTEGYNYVVFFVTKRTFVFGLGKMVSNYAIFIYQCGIKLMQRIVYNTSSTIRLSEYVPRKISH